MQAVKLIDDARRAQVTFKIQVQEWKNILIRGLDRTAFDKYRAQFISSSREVLSILDSLAARVHQESDIARRIASLSAAHQTLEKKYLAALEGWDGNDRDSYKKMDTAVKGIDRTPTAEMDELVKAIDETSRADMGGSFALFRNLLAVLIALLLAAGISAGILVVRSIVRPLEELEGKCRIIAEGDFTVHADDSFNDELARVAASFNGFVQRVKGVVSEVKSSADGLSFSSQEMSKTSAGFSENAQSQAASSEEITSALEEINSGMEMVSANTLEQHRRLTTLAERMQGLAGTVAQVDGIVGETRERARGITARAREGEAALKDTGSTMEKIRESSSRVMDIVGIINDISDKINLLSLNAAIEAARAGEAGRGFAVVAEEISKLADATAASIKDIESLLRENSSLIDGGMGGSMESIQALIGIIESMEEISAHIEEITERVQRQVQTSELVNVEARVVQERSEEIERNMSEQKNAVSEVTRSVISISDITQANAAGAEQLAAASGELERTAGVLKGQVGFFRL